MYAAIWRHLPGPGWLKLMEALLLIFAVVAVLFEFAFPWVANTLPAFDNTVG